MHEPSRGVEHRRNLTSSRHGRQRLTSCRTLQTTCLLLLALASPAAAQDPDVVREPSTEWIDQDTALTIELSRPLTPEEGRIVILLGTTDLTDLFRVEGTTYTYLADRLPLPSGEHELVVHRVSAQDEWVAFWRDTVKVRTRSGFEERRTTFGVDLQGSSQFGTSGDPADEVPPTETTATGRFSLQSAVSRGGWRLEASANVLGVSEIEEALRFAERAEQADRFDLADYNVRLSNDRQRAELGHVYYGSSRHLISSFSSRGLVLASPLGNWGTLRGAALNGSSIVGWSNPVGLSRSEHRVWSVGLGVEALPSRPGALRLDLDVLDASVLPLADFNQGVVNDAEENDGWSARLASSLLSGRVEVSAGYTRSEYRNPEDPLLFQGADVVAVDAEERSARHLDVDIALLRNIAFGEDQFTDLQLSLRHERIDPQYRTVGTFVQADREQNGADLIGSFGPVSMQVGHSRSEDNLDEIPSILKTKTRSTQFNFGLPLAMIFDERPRPWLPSAQLGFQRTAQRAQGQPIDGDFDSASHLPDQVSLDQFATLDWQGSRWQFGLSWNLSDQDNRQLGRDQDDFENESLGARVSLAPHDRLDVSVEWSESEARSLADGREELNQRWGLDTLWRITEAMSFSARYAMDESEDAPRTSTNESTNLDLEWSLRFAWREARTHGGSAQLFLRYSDQDFESEDQVFMFRFARDSQTIRAGFNLSFR